MSDRRFMLDISLTDACLLVWKWLDWLSSNTSSNLKVVIFVPTFLPSMQNRCWRNDDETDLYSLHLWITVSYFSYPESGDFDCALIGCFLLQSQGDDWLLSFSLPLDNLLKVCPIPLQVRDSTSSEVNSAVVLLRVVASEHRPSLNTSSLQIESRLPSLHLMKTLHSISSTLSSFYQSSYMYCTWRFPY